MELYGRIKYVLVFFADAIILPSACYPLIVVQDSLGPQFKKKQHSCCHKGPNMTVDHKFSISMLYVAMMI